MTSKLFEPLDLREISLHNRIVVSPMCQFSAEGGAVSDWHLMHIGQFAIANPGLILLEGTAVENEGRITESDLCLYNDEHEAALKRIVSFVRKNSQSKMGVQLFHSGRKGSQRHPWKAGDSEEAILPRSEGGWSGVAPSSIRFDDTFPIPDEATYQDLKRIKQSFVDSAIRAKRIGLDTVELHSFLSVVSNKRGDEYGGELENRMRFPLEVFEAVRNVWPEDKPLGARISGSDHGLAADSWCIEDAVIFSQALKASGCDYIDVSSGFLSPEQNIENYGPGFQVDLAKRIKDESGLSTFTVGVIVNGNQANDIIHSGKADAVCIGRGMLCDPRWTWRAAYDLGETPQFPPQYARAFLHQYPNMFVNTGKHKNK